MKVISSDDISVEFVDMGERITSESFYLEVRQKSTGARIYRVSGDALWSLYTRNIIVASSKSELENSVKNWLEYIERVKII